MSARLIVRHCEAASHRDPCVHWGHEAADAPARSAQSLLAREGDCHTSQARFAMTGEGEFAYDGLATASTICRREAALERDPLTSKHRGGRSDLRLYVRNGPQTSSGESTRLSARVCPPVRCLATGLGLRQ